MHGENEKAKFELYDIRIDPYETNDLAAQNPEQLATMKERLNVTAKADRDAVADD